MTHRHYFIRPCAFSLSYWMNNSFHSFGAWLHASKAIQILCFRAGLLCCFRDWAMAVGMASRCPGHCMQGLALCLSIWLTVAVSALANADPVPKPWPLQFHAQTYQNKTGTLSIVDLWYDFPNGRNLNLIQMQLGSKIWDVEHTNGTSYYFDLEAGTCMLKKFPVGILRPDFLSDATYLGVQELDGFTCNVWNKLDFMLYWEEVETQRMVSYHFLTTDQWFHIMTFEEGKVLEDQQWQAPSSCFENTLPSGSRSTLEDQISQSSFSKASFVTHRDLYHNVYQFSMGAKLQ